MLIVKNFLIIQIFIGRFICISVYFRKSVIEKLQLIKRNCYEHKINLQSWQFLSNHQQYLTLFAVLIRRRFQIFFLVIYKVDRIPVKQDQNI